MNANDANERAMSLCLLDAGLLVRRQVPLEVRFRDRVVGTFRADLIVSNELLVELKAVRAIEEAHVAQTINYLRATKLKAGLLLNFGPRPQFKRIVCTAAGSARPHGYHSCHSRPFA